MTMTDGDGKSVFASKKESWKHFGTISTDETHLVKKAKYSRKDVVQMLEEQKITEAEADEMLALSEE